jgi:DNA helicase-2/ATP-dependent DNA helicase PcrA
MPEVSDGLNAAQLEAVTHPGGPLLVLGAAGTGKTAALVERFAWLVEQGTAPESILALTYSPAAASGLRERLESRVERAHEDLRVASFRFLCERLLRDEALEAGLDPFFACVTPADRLALLLDRIDELTLRRHEIRGNPAPLIASFVTRIDRLKDEMVEAREYVAYAQRLQAVAASDAERAHAGRELEFARVYADHDALLAERGALDFGDLALHAFRLLHEKPHVRERLAARYRQILVDELQELKFSEGLVLRLLAQDHRNVWGAADDDQAIHRLRGAWRKNITDFRREYTDARVVRLERSYRYGRRILRAAEAVMLAGAGEREPKDVRARGNGSVRFWRARSDRAQAQAVAADVERLLTQDGCSPEQVAILVRSVRDEGQVVGSALEERAIPFRLTGSAAYFQRSEVRDVLAWLRLLADPSDSGAVVRALSRPPIDIRSVDIARLTQIARRRKLDMVSGVQAALESPQLSPEGRDRALQFLRIHRAASRASDEMRPEAFVHRLIEWIGLRRRQVFAAQADTVERLVNISKLADLAIAYMAREPDATTRDFTRYVAAVAEAGLPEDEAVPPVLPTAVRVMSMDAAKGCEWDHVFVLGLSAARVPGSFRPDTAAVPESLIKETAADAPLDARAVHEGEVRRLVHMAMTRARRGLVLAWAEGSERGVPPRPAQLYEAARAAVECEEELYEEQLFGPAEGLHSTFRMMRDELLDTVSEVGGRLSEMRLDTYLDVSGSVVRYLELLKLAALIERSKQGQSVADALPEVNDLLLQEATPDQRELFRTSALDDYLRDAEADERRRAAAIAAGADASLEPFIPRRGDGLMLSASDIETYRLCPLKYKFARVFRIPQEPSINQRFGIALHQVLERYHQGGGGTHEQLMQLFEASWRRCGFGDANDDLQYRQKAIAALRRYWEIDQAREAELAWVERSFAFKIGPHLLRGRVDRVDRLPDGTHELIDYKTGKPKTADDLRQDIQLSVYQMGAREAWGLETSAQSYYYVLDNEKVPVEHSKEELDRVRTTVTEIADGIMSHQFEPRPSPELCAFCDYRIVCPAAEK